MSRGKGDRFASGTYVGQGGGGGGGSASVALGNNAYAPVPNPAPAAGLTGSITPPFAFTPLVSGKIVFEFDVSGNADTAARLVTFTMQVGGVTQKTLQASPGGDPAFTLSSSGEVIVAGLTVGTPVAIQVNWASDAGTFQPGGGNGGITVFELPA